MSVSTGSVALLAVSVAFASVVGVAHSAIPERYAISSLEPPLGYNDFRPSSISSAGEVVGTAIDGISGAPAGVIWRTGFAAELGLPSGTVSHGVAMNDAGIVVGDSAIGPDVREIHAYQWDSGVPWDLGVAGHESGASSINSLGLIVGYERDSIGNAHAMLWEQGVGHRLDRFERGFSYAVAVNDAGQAAITAYASGPGGDAETYIAENGSLSSVGAFNATGINASGQVIGYEATPLPDIQGFLWDSSALRQIGDASTPFLPLAINDRGQIVGSTLTRAGAEHAAFWEDAVVLDLNEVVSGGDGWELWRATAINNAGQIVGYGTFSGQPRAFMLTRAAEYLD
jgi:probable HAF family extracellular repeat protein